GREADHAAAASSRGLRGADPEQRRLPVQPVPERPAPADERPGEPIRGLAPGRGRLAAVLDERPALHADAGPRHRGHRPGCELASELCSGRASGVSPTGLRKAGRADAPTFARAHFRVDIRFTPTRHLRLRTSSWPGISVAITHPRYFPAATVA